MVAMRIFGLWAKCILLKGKRLFTRMSSSNQNKEDDEKYPRITKKFLQKICKDSHLYMTPHLNDTLYLHFKGLMKIENLEEYTGLKSLWLENNGIKQIENLNCQTELRCLYLQENLISSIENLHHLQYLDSLNVSKNSICEIQNLSCLPNLNTLQISYNRLKTVADIQHLTKCHSITNVDLSYNMIDDPAVLDVFAAMLSLKDLCYLDDRPVTDKERACVNAWSKGGIEAERKERIRWNEMEQEKIRRSVEAVLALRRGKTNMKLLAELEKKDTTEESSNKTKSQCSKDGDSKITASEEIRPQQQEVSGEFFSKEVTPAIGDTSEYKENNVTIENSNKIESLYKEGSGFGISGSGETHRPQIQKENYESSNENFIPVLEDASEIKGNVAVKKYSQKIEFQHKEDKYIKISILQESHQQSNNEEHLSEKRIPVLEDAPEFNNTVKNNSNEIESQCKKRNDIKTLESNECQQRYDNRKNSHKSTVADFESAHPSPPLIENDGNFSDEKAVMSILNEVKCQLCIMEAAMKLSKEITPPKTHSSENSLPSMDTNKIVSKEKEIFDDEDKQFTVSEKNISNFHEILDNSSTELIQSNNFDLTQCVKGKENGSNHTTPNRSQEKQIFSSNEVVQKTENVESQLLERKESSQEKQDNATDTKISMKILEEESNRTSSMNELSDTDRNGELILKQNDSAIPSITNENDYCHFTLCHEVIKKEEEYIISKGEKIPEKMTTNFSKMDKFNTTQSTRNEFNSSNKDILINDLKSKSNSNENQVNNLASFYNDKVLEEAKSNLMTSKMKEVSISSNEIQICGDKLSESNHIQNNSNISAQRNDNECIKDENETYSEIKAIVSVKKSDNLPIIPTKEGNLALVESKLIEETKNPRKANQITKSSIRSQGESILIDRGSSTNSRKQLILKDRSLMPLKNDQTVNVTKSDTRSVCNTSVTKKHALAVLPSKINVSQNTAIDKISLSGNLKTFSDTESEQKEFKYTEGNRYQKLSPNVIYRNECQNFGDIIKEENNSNEKVPIKETNVNRFSGKEAVLATPKEFFTSENINQVTEQNLSDSKTTYENSIKGESGIIKLEEIISDSYVHNKVVHLTNKDEINTDKPDFVFHDKNETILMKFENSDKENTIKNSYDNDFIASEKSNSIENNTLKFCSSKTESNEYYKIRNKDNQIAKIDEHGLSSEDKAAVRSQRQNDNVNRADIKSDMNNLEKNANNEKTNESSNIDLSNNANNGEKNNSGFSYPENIAALRLHRERNFEDDVSTDESIGSSSSSTSSDDSSYSISEDEREIFLRKINVVKLKKQKLQQQKSAKLQESLSLLEEKLSLKESNEGLEDILEIRNSLSLLEEKLSSSISNTFPDENYRSIDFSEKEHLNSSSNSSMENSETLNESSENLANPGTNTNNFQVMMNGDLTLTTIIENNLKSIRNESDRDIQRQAETTNPDIKLIASSFLQDLVTKTENCLKRDDETIPKEKTKAQFDVISENEQFELEEMILQTHTSTDLTQTEPSEQEHNETEMFVSKFDLKAALAEIDSLGENSLIKNLTDEEKECKSIRNKNGGATTETILSKTRGFANDNYKTSLASDCCSPTSICEHTVKIDSSEIQSRFTFETSNKRPEEPKTFSPFSSLRYEREINSFSRKTSIEEWDIDNDEDSSISPSNLTRGTDPNMYRETSRNDLRETHRPMQSKNEKLSTHKEKHESRDEISYLDMNSNVRLNRTEECLTLPNKQSENDTLKRIYNNKSSKNEMSEYYDTSEMEDRNELLHKRSTVLFAEDSHKYLTSNKTYAATEKGGVNKKMAFKNNTLERNSTSVDQDEEEDCIITFRGNQSSSPSKQECIFRRRPALTGNGNLPKIFHLGLQDDSMSDSEISEVLQSDDTAKQIHPTQTYGSLYFDKLFRTKSNTAASAEKGTNALRSAALFQRRDQSKKKLSKIAEHRILIEELD
ncbi:dynein assembly factor 1, axonemal [Nephila pilipes]|uniref:Dynein axonemal assembly factor 1 homolog n=1 Tax=Nephila pilipes TaxID=299642 RepID=A0A8X6Q1N8_NEPPI|nr:dynein assembly factor 1, axonemal [Nephila pilipes]